MCELLSGVHLGLHVSLGRVRHGNFRPIPQLKVCKRRWAISLTRIVGASGAARRLMLPKQEFNENPPFPQLLTACPPLGFKPLQGLLGGDSCWETRNPNLEIKRLRDPFSKRLGLPTLQANGEKRNCKEKAHDFPLLFRAAFCQVSRCTEYAEVVLEPA